MQLRGVYLSIASCGNLRCHFLGYLAEGGRFLKTRDWGGEVVVVVVWCGRWLGCCGGVSRYMSSTDID